MKKQHLYQQFSHLKATNKTAFVVLADPDKITVHGMTELAELCRQHGVDYLFIGGSLLMVHQMEACIRAFRAACNAPILLFPGSPSQVTPLADGLLYLSLISSRNADLLIGQHVISAPAVKASGLEVISTGYMLIDGGISTTVSYISHSLPIPAHKPEIAVCTAWAAELQGKHIIYMDAGSGAAQPVSLPMIKAVSQNINIPLIVGGGIHTPEKMYENAMAGANLIVAGNAIEKDSSLIKEMALAVKQANDERGA
ncbi:MAG: geranylgeranylglyceryl/heptaprenylglyceryl phosphate synthase [Chitinophagia bacterium]|nr:geranylgeranylglyceryl/heptaprenylglyceryl phosphate synthase [Chitinophagia bacterium]